MSYETDDDNFRLTLHGSFVFAFISVTHSPEILFDNYLGSCVHSKGKTLMTKGLLLQT